MAFVPSDVRPREYPCTSCIDAELDQPIDFEGPPDYRMRLGIITGFFGDIKECTVCGATMRVGGTPYSPELEYK